MISQNIMTLSGIQLQTKTDYNLRFDYYVNGKQVKRWTYDRKYEESNSPFFTEIITIEDFNTEILITEEEKINENNKE